MYSSFLSQLGTGLMPPHSKTYLDATCFGNNNHNWEFISDLMAEEPIFLWASHRDSFSLQKHSFLTLVISPQSILLFPTQKLWGISSIALHLTHLPSRDFHFGIVSCFIIMPLGFIHNFGILSELLSRSSSRFTHQQVSLLLFFSHHFACVRPVWICAI